MTTVILFFNKPSLTIRCLESATRAEAPPENVILVDNGSTAENAALVREHCSSRKIPARFVRIEVNAGFAAGMNAGLAAAFGESGASWCAALSNDIELDPLFFSALRARSPDAAARILCPTAHFLKKRSKIAYTHGWFDRSKRGFDALSHHSGAIEEIKPPLYYPAAGMVWNKAAFERLNGFDAGYPCYWEDVDLSFRAAERGVILRAAPDLRLHHLGRGTTAGKPEYVQSFFVGERRFRSLYPTR